jgi:hypothetical protein
MSFKKKRRKGYKRMVGYNHKITTFRVAKVDPGLDESLMSKTVVL